MSQTPLLIFPDTICNDTEVRILQTENIQTQSISDNVLTIENGRISGLLEPILDDQIATKFYVDNNTGSATAVGPNGSLQYNDNGNVNGSINLVINNPGTPTSTLQLNGTFLINSVVINGGNITGVTTGPLGTDAVNKLYVDNTLKLTNSNFNVQMNIGQIFTPAQIYNQVVSIDVASSNLLGFCPPDFFPSTASMATYLGSKFVVGHSWITIIKFPEQQQYLLSRLVGKNFNVEEGVSFLPKTSLCGPSLPVTFMTNYVSIKCVCTITSIAPTATYSIFVTESFLSVEKDSRITNDGVLTDSFGTALISSTSFGSIIYPLTNNLEINDTLSVVYSYQNLKRVLIIRSGLTGPTSDTFDDASVIIANQDFNMGSGTFKVYIQNISSFLLTLTPSVGWTFIGSATIPAGKVSSFLISVNTLLTTCTLTALGNKPI